MANYSHVIKLQLANNANEVQGKLVEGVILSGSIGISMSSLVECHHVEGSGQRPGRQVPDLRAVACAVQHEQRRVCWISPVEIMMGNAVGFYILVIRFQNSITRLMLVSEQLVGALQLQPPE